MKKISLRKSLMGLLLVLGVFIVGVVEADNYENKIEVSNIDASTNEMLSGSTLAIYDSNGNEVDKWVTSTDKHYTYNLSVGEYTLKELSASSGYSLSESSTIFNVCEEDKIIYLTMENTKESYQEVVVSVPDTFSSNSVIYIISIILIVVGSLVAYNYKSLRNE